MERDHFFVCHAGEVVYYIMGFSGEDVYKRQLFHGSRGSHDAVKDEQGKGNAFVLSLIHISKT